MSAAPLPNAAETRDNAAFDALLWALSRPGLPRTLPEPGEGPIIAALLDRECRVHSAEPRLVPEIMRTGAEIADISRADHVFLGTMTSRDALTEIAVGSDLYPDDGATVVLRAQIGTGPAVRLRGPGIDGELVVQVGGLPGGFWETRAARARYPMGFDLFVVEGAEVLGIPRSTEVEVL
ncbi:phosphonate C-P lyase system protein PhnH [uncultured Roseobacter sp.]|uniref:phosphonate C-P lyase system protein PhnH n=1 Tax=uncultured Roseobacter sp. TaxID=114847 RepID=UPI002615782C|nr:phosphonate C-P lyase system protein PhnH [uncultured Roseobacter sp.]